MNKLYLLLGAAIATAFALACEADGGNRQQASTTPTPSALPQGDFPPGVLGEPIVYRPAASDRYGGWSVVEIHGVSVEVPLNPRWRTRIIQDPCFGDERYFILMEDRETGDRVRVDMVNARIASVSAVADRIRPLRERILRSLSGKHEAPVTVQTFGPHPTLTTCAGVEDDVVPTLSPDESTPPPPAVTPPVAVATPAPPIRPDDSEGTEEIEP